MTPAEWAEVFRAGANGIDGTALIRNPSLPDSLYGAAALRMALTRMAEKCAEIGGRDG